MSFVVYPLSLPTTHLLQARTFDVTKDKISGTQFYNVVLNSKSSVLDYQKSIEELLPIDLRTRKLRERNNPNAVSEGQKFTIRSNGANCDQNGVLRSENQKCLKFKKLCCCELNNNNLFDLNHDDNLCTVQQTKEICRDLNLNSLEYCDKNQGSMIYQTAAQDHLEEDHNQRSRELNSMKYPNQLLCVDEVRDFYSPYGNDDMLKYCERFPPFPSLYNPSHPEQSEFCIKTEKDLGKNFDSNIIECDYECKYYLNKETNRRNRVLICKYNGCNRVFTKTWGLKEHYRVHSKEKPFECEVCGTKFTQKGSLLKHIRKNANRVSHSH